MRKPALFPLLAAALALAASCANAVECASRHAAGLAFTVCRVDVRHEDLRLFYADAQGVRYETFARLRDSLAREGRALTFAMNAGMYHPDMRPVGLLVIDGREIAPLNTSVGEGNFFLKPNGVFLIDEAGARVVATAEVGDAKPRFATQSGPMLVRGGEINAVFNPSSRSRHLRNGVCAPTVDEAVFAVSEEPVTFYEFSALFLDELGCRDALYLDGTISSLYAPDLGRADARAPFGPIVGVTAASPRK